MNKIAYYRKYRPINFEKIQGQDFIVKTLRNAISQNKISHAYILSGPRGIGKTSIAKIFSKAINCLNPIDGDCCNKCKNCELINSNKTLDVIEMDAASNNGVNEIRTIIDGIEYKPLDLKSKVYIIDEAHMLTNAAWNALLKTIEDPPKHLIFIFATTESFKIPATIISRCQRYSLSKLSYSELKNELNNIIEQENIKIEDLALDKIISIAEGSARDALTILDQLDSYTNSNIKDEDVKDIFGLVSIEDKLDFISSIVASDYEKVISKIDDYDKKGIDFYRLALEISEILFEKLVYEKTKKVNFLNILPAVNINFIFIQPKILISLIEIWQKYVGILKYSTSSRFSFESACLSSFKIFEFDNHSSNNEEKQIQKDDVIKDVKITKPVIKQTDENETKLKMNYVEKEVILKNVTIKKPVVDEVVTLDEKPVIVEEKREPLKVEVKKDENKNVSEQSVKKNVSKNDSQSIVDAIISKSFETKSIKLSEIKNRFTSNKKPLVDKQQEVVEAKKEEPKKVSKTETKAKKESTNFDENNLFNMVYDDGVDNIPHVNLVAKDLGASTNSSTKKVEPVVSKPKEEPSVKQQQKQEPINLDEVKKIDNTHHVEETFFRIAFNNNPKEKEKIVSIFNELKNNIPISPEEGLLTDAQKILLVSNTGIVILFNDEIDARNINSANESSKFVTYVKNKFGKVYYVLGVSTQEAKRITEIYKEYYKQNKKFDDVNVDDLSKKVKTKSTAKDIAERLVSDLIEDEEE